MTILYVPPKLSPDYYVVSMSILDDLEHFDNFPKHMIVDKLDDLFSIIQELVKSYEKYGKDLDPVGMFDKSGVGSEYYENDNFIKDVCSGLIDDHYYVINRVNKYYVIAFAINYTKFEIYSKDKDKEFIDWKYSPSSDEVIKIGGIIDDPEYNENPVIKLLQALSAFDKY